MEMDILSIARRDRQPNAILSFFLCCKISWMRCVEPTESEIKNIWWDQAGLQIQFLMYHNNEQQTYLMNYFQKLFKYHLQ